MASKTIASHVIQTVVPPGAMRHEVELGAELLSESSDVEPEGTHVHSVPLRFSRYHLVPVTVVATLESGSVFAQKLLAYADMGDSFPNGIGNWAPSFTHFEGSLVPIQYEMTPRMMSLPAWYGMLDAAAASQTINLNPLLPNDAVIIAAESNLITPFSGGSVASAVARVGTAGDPSALIADRDIFTGATEGPASADGTRPVGSYGAAQLQVAFDVTGGNVSDLEAGWLDINVYYLSAEPPALPFGVYIGWDGGGNQLTVTVANLTGGLANISVVTGMESWVQPAAPETSP